MKTEKPMKVTLGTQETQRGSFLLQFENLQIRELNRKTKTNVANAIKYNTFYYLVDKNLPAGKLLSLHSQVQVSIPLPFFSNHPRSDNK